MRMIFFNYEKCSKGNKNYDIFRKYVFTNLLPSRKYFNYIYLKLSIHLIFFCFLTGFSEILSPIIEFLWFEWYQGTQYSHSSPFKEHHTLFISRIDENKERTLNRKGLARIITSKLALWENIVLSNYITYNFRLVFKQSNYRPGSHKNILILFVVGTEN